jgi:hypothetical protein
MTDLITWAIWISLFGISYFIGTYREKAHLRNIVERE